MVLLKKMVLAERDSRSEKKAHRKIKFHFKCKKGVFTAFHKEPSLFVIA